MNSSTKKATTLEDLKFDMSIKDEYHPIANQEPLMYGTVKKIAESMLEVGYVETNPVTMYEGKILDGRTRTIAATAIGLKIPSVTFKGTLQEAQAESDRLNNSRRHRTKGQSAMMAAYIVLDARENIALMKSEIREKKPNISKSSMSRELGKSDNFIRYSHLSNIENLAKKYDVSEQYIKDCIKYINFEYGLLYEMCENLFYGNINMTQAKGRYKEVRDSILKAKREVREMSEEELLLYEMIDLAKEYPEVAGREIVHLRNLVKIKEEEMAEKIDELMAELSVIHSVIDDIDGNGKPSPTTKGTKYPTVASIG